MAVSILVIALEKAADWLLDKGIDLIRDFQKEKKEKLKTLFNATGQTLMSTAEHLQQGTFPTYHCEKMRLLHEALTRELGDKKDFETFLQLLGDSVEIERVYFEMTGETKAENIAVLQKAAAAFDVAALDKF